MKQLDIRGTENSPNADSALDFLSLFHNDDFWNLLTVETNRYAHQFLASHEIKPHSRFHQWSDVTVSEIENASGQNTLLVGTEE